MRTIGAMRQSSDHKQETRLESEATAWRGRRSTRPKFSMEGVQVVRIHKRRPASEMVERTGGRTNRI